MVWFNQREKLASSSVSSGSEFEANYMHTAEEICSRCCCENGCESSELRAWWRGWISHWPFKALIAKVPCDMVIVLIFLSEFVLHQHNVCAHVFVWLECFRRSSIVFKTAGVLLDEMRDKGMHALDYKVIVLDEVHERSVESDLVLVCIKQFLMRNNNLRLASTCPFIFVLIF